MTNLILLFDGHCLLCDGFVRWLMKRDPHARLRFASLQSSTGRDLLAAYHLPAGFADSVVAVYQGRARLRSDAVLQALSVLGGPWWLLAALGRLIPRPLREAAYRFIARRRYRWFGRHDGEACPLPSPAERTRLLP